MKIAVSFLLAAAFAFGAADPFVGTWALNVQKSKYAPGTCPKKMTIEMEPAANGVHYRSETINASGKVSRSEYTAEYSGKEALVMGSLGMMTPVTLERPDSNTVVASYVRGMQPIATSKRVVSKDGRVMTVTTTSKDKLGKSVVNIGVYERVSSTVASRLPAQ